MTKDFWDQSFYYSFIQTCFFSFDQSNQNPTNQISIINTPGGDCPQYLIKWKMYSHLHNTWESDDSLREKTAKGVKKVDNFIKKQEELDNWKMFASPEDIDYMECQREMEQDLIRSHTLVER